MDKIYLTDAEWRTAKQISDKHNSSLREVGRIEQEIFRLQKVKDNIFKGLEEFDGEYKQYFEDIKTKYGVGDIDTDTGEFVKRNDL